MELKPGRTYIGRLRALGLAGDALAARQHLDRALAVADLHPPGLPPEAILCVRRLSVKAGRVQSPAGRPTRASQAWVKAAREELARLVQSASRPAQTAASPGAEAVLFANRAELLACLAQDACDGSLAERWWWERLAPPGGQEGRMARAWREAPEWVPAALERLARQGRAQDFSRRLSSGESRQILAAVSGVFGLTGLEAPQPQRNSAERGGAPSHEPRRLGAVRWAGQPGQPEPSASREAETALDDPPPWLPAAPEVDWADAGLSWEQTCLLGVGLALARAPALARSAGFIERVRRWREAVQAGAPPRAASNRPPPRPAADPLEQYRQSPNLQAPAGSHPPGTGDESPQASPARPARKQPDPQPAGQAPGRQSAELQPGDPALSGSKVTAEKPFSAQPRLAGARDAQPVVEDLPGDDTIGIETQFGGVFYLINLALYLGLYADFSDLLRPEAGAGDLDLPLWDFLALAGRALLGPAFESDPIWQLLANLAVRHSDEPPGAEFAPPQEWRLPPTWLEPFTGPRTWVWSAMGGRLRVRHPAGFWVLDVIVDEGLAGERLAQELERYGEVRMTYGQPPAEAESTAGLERWLGWLLAYLRARLQLTLGLEGPGDLPRFLLTHRARVRLAAAHLDITLALDELPVEIRLAGLDRDPWWVPAAGCFIAFHFD